MQSTEDTVPGECLEHLRLMCSKQRLMLDGPAIVRWGSVPEEHHRALSVSSGLKGPILHHNDLAWWKQSPQRTLWTVHNDCISAGIVEPVVTLPGEVLVSRSTAPQRSRMGGTMRKLYNALALHSNIPQRFHNARKCNSLWKALHNASTTQQKRALKLLRDQTILLIY